LSFLKLLLIRSTIVDFPQEGPPAIPITKGAFGFVYSMGGISPSRFVI